jgi:hypothetical protein
MLQIIVRVIGILSLGSICLLYAWFGMRDWRLFFLKEPLRPMPAWVNRLALYLWLAAAIPWGITTIVQGAKDFLRDHSQNTKAAWFAIGFIAFCCVLSLAAKFLPLDKKVHLAKSAGLQSASNIVKSSL